MAGIKKGKKKKSVTYNRSTGTKTTTKVTNRGVVKKKTTGGGVMLKQKTKPSGQQKIKGIAMISRSGKKLTVRNKGVVKSSVRRKRK